MGWRIGSHGANSWSIPGGHLEFGEGLEAAAAREVFEETGVKVKNIRFGALTNDYFKDQAKHYISIWMIADYDSGEPSVKEPNKFINPRWVSFDAIPKPLFHPWKQLLKSEFMNFLKLEAAKTKAND